MIRPYLVPFALMALLPFGALAQPLDRDTAEDGFTRICNSGEPADTGDCPAEAEPGTEANAWACVRDNATGLIWEVKTAANQHDTYSWDDASRVFTAAVNAAELCGYADWRLPTQHELISIIDFGTRNPAIDRDFFPNTVSNFYWSADTFAPIPTRAWTIDFFSGAADAFGKPNEFRVRLVRGGT